MRLKQIKLAGFKSFVDLTKVPFPHQMTAIVGPNGCGKSNIIDAVRWVLGESSAKNLRGDAMTDVIFNGAAKRKSVGQASVELTFDNSQTGDVRDADSYTHAHKLANRSEISIRRQVNRDGQNHYFLNGSKCRRRDITDIFLGTGLGPRSYAIIEQGTISRLIESKPQELRVFIEEAAGISQYKERRRETELKIKHTVENVQRLDDIRFEVEQQLEKLHIQAEAAKQFRHLKQNERRLKSESIALQWQSNQHALKELSEAIDDEQANINENTQASQQIESTLYQLQDKLASKNAIISQLQLEKEEHAKHCIVAEESLKYALKQQQKINQQQTLLENQLNIATSEQEGFAEDVKTVDASIERHIGKSVGIEKDLNQNRSTLHNEQMRLNEMQTRWNHLNQINREQIQTQKFLHDNKAKLLDEKSRLKTQIEKGLEQMQALESQQIKRVDYQQERAHLTELLNGLSSELLANKSTNEHLEQQYKQHQQQVASLEKQQRQISHSIELLANLLDQKQDWQNIVEQRVDNTGEDLQFLYQLIDVEPDWSAAVTSLLGHMMQAPVINSAFDSTNLQQFCVIDKASLTSDKKNDTIAEKINAPMGILPWLNYVFLAEDDNEARDKLSQCKAYESVICKDGTWYGHGFLIKGHLHVNQDSVESVLDTKFQLKNLEVEYKRVSADLNQQATLSEHISKQLEIATQQQLKIKEKLGQYDLELKQIEHQQQTESQHQSWHQQQIERNEIVHKDLKNRAKEVSAELSLINQKIDAISLCQSQQQDHVALGEEQTKVQQHVTQLHQVIERQQSEHRQLTLSIEQSRMQHIQMTQSQQHANAKVDMIKQQLSQLANEEVVDLQQLSEQVSEMQKCISDLNEKLSSLNKDVTFINQQNASLEQEQRKRILEIDEKRALVTQGQINLQNYRVRCETYIEQLKETGDSPSAIVEQLPQHVTDKSVERELNKIKKSLLQLGAINLAAIEEYQQHISRKKHLDLQYEDLTQAISTLESAIVKIDQESRQKFKVTFEQVNDDLKTLFPKVFGGGSAYLALTSEDLLETGVTIMARPPGKKNSTIHLLSGGEKALTALSLVFAIFRLNPAPFCMLDEVDAPLDDANVGRFCNLVREMSQTVQFIFISHNKIAMEMASHLTGVTMFEPGVSRMVSVDIDEAIAMAEVS